MSHSCVQFYTLRQAVQCCYISPWACHRQCQHFSTNKLNRSSLPPFMQQKCTEWLQNRDQNPVCACMFSPWVSTGSSLPHNPHDMHRWTGDTKLPIAPSLQSYRGQAVLWMDIVFHFYTVNFWLNEKYIKPHAYWLNMLIFTFSSAFISKSAVMVLKLMIW